MLESAQPTNKVDLNYYAINPQWFRVLILSCVICRTQIWDPAYKDNSWQTYQWLLTKKERKKESKKKWFKTFLQAFTGNFWISLNCIICRTSIDHTKMD